MVKEGACGSELEVERQAAVEVLACGGPGEVYGVGIGHQGNGLFVEVEPHIIVA